MQRNKPTVQDYSTYTQKIFMYGDCYMSASYLLYRPMPASYIWMLWIK